MVYQASAKAKQNMSNVAPLGNITKLDLPVARVLEGAKEKLESVVILGYTKDGEEYFASTMADGGEALWLLRRCEKALLEVPDDM